MVATEKLGAIAGLAAPIVAFLCVFSAIASYSQFSWTDNALSDLGIVKGLTSGVFNFGLVVAGVLGVVFAALGLFNFFTKSSLGKVGSGFFVATCVALVCIGVFNENFSPTHYLVSVAFFSLAPITLFILTLAFIHRGNRSLAVLSVTTGAIAAASWILEFTLYYVSGVAVPETISALAVAVWVVAVVVKMLRKS
jgi:hypothetical membrane protein